MSLAATSSNSGTAGTAGDPPVPDRSSRESLFAELAERVGTPAYIYDADEPGRRVEELRRVLPPSADTSLLYSFKANPLPSLAGELSRSGCEADLTSPGEIAAAREAGFDLSRALYGGPGKSEEEYAGAIRSGLSRFSVESSLDLARLSSAAEKAGVRVEVLLRLNPHSSPKAKLAMSGVASQFGFEEDELRARGAELLRGTGKRVSVVGFHLYWGTQIAESGALLASFEKTVELAGELAPRLGIPLEILNLGGGFPWPYAHRGAGTDLSPLREGLGSLRERSGLAGKARWWFESGRHLVASSGTLLTRVREIKRSKDDRNFLILDTGIHHLGGMAGLGRIPRFSIDLEVPLARLGNETLVVDIVGPLCTPLDCLAKKIEIPRLEPGDLLSIPNVGAYGATASVTAFLSRTPAAEILHRGGEILAMHRLRGGHAPIV